VLPALVCQGLLQAAHFTLMLGEVRACRFEFLARSIDFGVRSVFDTAYVGSGGLAFFGEGHFLLIQLGLKACKVLFEGGSAFDCAIALMDQFMGLTPQHINDLLVIGQAPFGDRASVDRNGGSSVCNIHLL
jgi:hypothetical protein